MLDAFGRKIPVTVEELLCEPCALVVWDMQVGIATRATNYLLRLATIPPLLAAARRRDVPVIFSQHYSLPLEREVRPWIRTMWMRGGRPEPAALKPLLPIGSPDWEFVPEIVPEAGDVVIPKTRASFFAGTPFASVLAGLGIDMIVMVGVATDRGVVATAREGVHRGVFTVAVSDAVGSFSEEDQRRGLEELAVVADVCDSAQALAAWGA